MEQVACAMGGIVTIDFENSDDPKIERIDFEFFISIRKIIELIIK